MSSARFRARLSTKILAAILPPVLLCLLALGAFSAVNASRATQHAVETHLAGVLDTFVAQNMEAKQRLLRSNGLDAVNSFVASYQERAAEAIEHIDLLWPGRVFVVDFQGTIVAERGRAEQRGMPVGEPWRRIQLRWVPDRGGIETGVADDGESEVFYVGRRFLPWRWDIFVAVERDAVDAGSYRIHMATVILTAVCCVLVVLVLAAAIRSFVAEPLRALGAAASRIGTNGGPARIPVASGDEIGDLARDLARLAATIAANEKDLRAWNEGLESKVRERMRELAKANAELRGAIARRRTAEDAVEESRRKYLRLFEDSNDAILLVDDDGNLIEGNGRFSACTGLNGARLGLARIEDIVEPDGIEAFRAALERLRHSGHERFETVLRGGGGMAVPVDVSAGRIEIGGRFLVQAVMRESNDHRRVDAASHRPERMDAAARLVGGIANGFENLLAAIVERAEAISGAAAAGEGVRRDAEAIRRAANRGATLTERLVAFSRETALSPQILDIAATLGQLRPALERTLGEGVTIAITLEAGLPKVFVDRLQFEAAVAFLVANGSDAMPDGGTLVVDARMTGREGAGGAGRFVRIGVRDSGAAGGRAAPARAVGRGAGSGLGMVYGFARQSGGAVEVRTEPGAGTEVVLLLPAAGEGVDARAGQ